MAKEGKKKEAPEKIKELASVSVLVVDDCELQRGLHSKMLKEFGVKDIETANGGEEGLEKLANKNYHLVVSDWQMPGMDGGTFMQKMKELPNYQNTPFIICSGELEDKDIYLAVEFGIAHYLVKPIKAEQYSEQLKIIFSKDKTTSAIEEKMNQLAGAIADGEFKASLKTLSEMQKKYPKAGKVLEYMGDCSAGLEDYPQAILDYKKALALLPKNIVAQNKLARAYLKNKQTHKAIKLMEDLRQLSPNNINRLITMGGAYLEVDDADKAEEVFSEASEMDEENPEAKDGLGKSLFAQGKYSKAIGLLRNTQKAGEMASYFNNLGIALVRKKKFEDAEKLYINAVKILPAHDKTPNLLFNIGLACKKDKKLDRAAGFF